MERFAIKIDKKLKANLYKICRLCGMDNPDMVPILSSNEANKDENGLVDVEAEMEMSQKINLLIGLSVTKDDKMPQTMCGLCVDKINDFYEFREMCYATNTQTRKLLGLKNIKKPVVDIKPKVEIKEEEIVPTPISNKNGNRKRKSDEAGLKEEPLLVGSGFPKKKLRFSTPAETAVKEEVPLAIKKKLRFTVTTDEISMSATSSNKLKKEPTPPIITSNKKLKLTLAEDSKTKKEDTKLKKEPSPPLAPAVSNKKLRLVAPSQKETASKKSKQKGGKNGDAEVKEEIKEEIKEEPITTSVLVLPTTPEVLPTPKLKFGCNICTERFSTKVKLETHTRTVHLPKIERYVCTACNEVLNKSFDIKNHQLWHKLSKTPYVCGCCGESILNTYAFSRHLREHAFETPPALLVLDRECPQCHTSYATNFLYNIHICAVKTKRCAGCNRLQRNEAEYLKHSAQCAKVYLNYSRHIMPSVEALEDSVRIKNENDVEAAAEEMARISGVSLDMAPVVQLTRLSSPLILAANQCVSIPGVDDAASTSSKKSGKKGVSKKDLKRVDELLKSTLDALVSIKHEPEVHVEQEAPSSDEHTDNDGNQHLDVEDDHIGNLDDFHHNEDDSDNDENTNTATASETGKSTGLEKEEIKIKQEVDEGNEENINKIGGSLKLKIKKEHGQLNSSIIEQQKSTEKRAEKRKKKKKHKDKEKDKQRLSKDLQDEQVSQDSNANNNGEERTIRIKTEPQDGADTLDMAIVAPVQMRPQPEATIMTSIPMMQFQIACVSSGVEFNNSVNQQTALALNHEIEPEDVKPNREELDRMLKISHVSGGIAMESNEMEEAEDQAMDHDGNDNVDDYHKDSIDDNQYVDDNESERYEDNQFDDHETGEEEVGNEVVNINEAPEDGEIDNEKIIFKNIKKPKSKTILKDKEKTLMETSSIKSRNKACKSTAKAPNTPVLQISAVQSGVVLETSSKYIVPGESYFTPIFIKPEPQNRGYADEQPTTTLELMPPNPPQLEDQSEIPQTHSAEEQNYISSIDFNNLVIKQEKDIEINDVQICKKSSKSYADFNGVKRKRKQIHRSHIEKDKTNEENGVESNDENMKDNYYEDTDEEDGEEYDQDEAEVEEEEEDEEEVEEEEDEDEEEEDDENEEEREYRELEYPPQIENNSEAEEKEDNLSKVNKHDQNIDGVQKDQQDIVRESIENLEISKSFEENTHILNSNTEIIAPSNEKPAFIISSVCSRAEIDNLKKSSVEIDNSKLFNVSVSETQILTIKNHENTIIPNVANVYNDTKQNNDDKAHILCSNIKKESISGSNNHLNINMSENLNHSNSDMTSNYSLLENVNNQVENTQTLESTLPSHELHGNIQSMLQFGQTFEANHGDQISQALDFRQEPKFSDSTAQNSQIDQESVRQQSQESHCLDPIAQGQLIMDHETQISQNITQGDPQNIQDSLKYMGQVLQTTQDNLRNTGQVPQSAQVNKDDMWELQQVVSNDTNRLQYSTQDAQIVQQTPVSHNVHQMEQYLEHDSQVAQSEHPREVEPYSAHDVTDKFECETDSKYNKQLSETCGKTLPSLAQNAEIVAESRLHSQQIKKNILLYSTQNDECAPGHGLNSQHLLAEIGASGFTTLKRSILDAKISKEDTKTCHENQQVGQILEPSEPQTSQNLSEAVFKISSVTSGALDGFNPTISNNYGDKIVKDNQKVGIATIEGAVEQTKELDSLAQPVAEILENENCLNEDGHEDENDNEDNNTEDDNTLGNNLEEQQNYQNQEVLSQIRPAALALHPYLEDISSSSNSLLSNSLSQTPPPPQPALSNAGCSDAYNTQEQLHPQRLNIEETENILNESNDIFSRHSSEIAAASSVSAGLLHLQQQLPPHMPTFNFDNINEIAENNNNANIEREQLQDEQQQASENVT